MKFSIYSIMLIFIGLIMSSCGKSDKAKESEQPLSAKDSVILERINIYAPTAIKADISRLNERQKKMVGLLIEAGKIADEIFWKQTTPDAIAIRDSLRKLNTTSAKLALDFVNINYGPYDAIEEGKRYIGSGPEKKPDVANLYPQDITKEEFEKYIAEHPEQKAELESQYTVVVRDGAMLKAIPYHVAYPEAAKIAVKLEEAATYCDNPSLKKYLLLRSEAIRLDDYYESDMAWLDIKDNDVDVIIGPIENYEDRLFNYKTAYEAVVFVRDLDATKELQMFRSHINDFQEKLPCDKKYISSKSGAGESILNIVNVCYFGGDCQAGVKTIACNLPNDPKVRDQKGGKNTMYKNMMEAKFEKIVVPIAERILDASLVPLVDKKAFIGFVTLHEVSHTLGRDYVFGKKDLSVRKAMMERYSAIEETKADILSMYNHKHLAAMGIYTQEYVKQAIATYIAGLYRSIRFGAEEAHGRANLIQLNFLRQSGALVLQDNGRFNIDMSRFFDSVGELAKMVLTVEAEGDYEGAGKILEKYGQMTDEIKAKIESLKGIPRDLNTSYEL